MPDGVFERFGEGDLRCIFLHELAHVKRGDLGVNWVVSMLQVMHWFNPVLRLAFARMRADREMAADALALAHVGKAKNVAYGETILKVVENLTRDAAKPGLVGIAESKAGLAQRVRAIAQFSASRHWRWPAVVMAIAVAGVGLTDARQETAKQVRSPAISTEKAKPLREITGVIVDPDGHPASGAQVGLMIRKLRPQMTGEYMTVSELGLSGAPRLFNPEFGHPMGGTRSVPWNYCTTERDGRFYLDGLEGATSLLVADEKGFARIETNQFSANMTVKLEPWGRVDGAVWHYNETVTNELVSAWPADWHDKWGQASRFEAITDASGHFVFDYVPPGRFILFAAGINKRFIVESAGTTVLKVGGDGRTVIGRFKVSDPGIKIKWDENTNVFCSLLAEPPRPLQAFDTANDYRVWRNRPEVRDWVSKRDVFAYHVQTAADGTFRIDQVEPGNYYLYVNLRDPRDQSGLKFLRPFREFNRTFYVAASKSKDSGTVDLGVVEISIFQGAVRSE